MRQVVPRDDGADVQGHWNAVWRLRRPRHRRVIQRDGRCDLNARRPRGRRLQGVPHPQGAGAHAQGARAAPAPPQRFQRVPARCATSRSASRAASSSASSGATAPASRTLLKCLAGIYRSTRATSSSNGRTSTFIELGVGFNPDLAARDNVDINAAMLGLSRREARAALRHDHRLRRAARVRRPEAQELLVGHARAPRLRGDDPGRRRHPADRRGARGRRRRLPAEVLRRVRDDPRERARRSCSSRTTCRAVQRFCDRAMLLEHGRMVVDRRPGDGRQPLPGDELLRVGARLAPQTAAATAPPSSSTRPARRTSSSATATR